MNSELKILKIVWVNKKEGSIRLISHQAGFGMGYTHHICNCLLKKEQLQQVEGKRDWYRVTSKGKKRLEQQRLIEVKKSEKLKSNRKVGIKRPIRIKSPKGNLIEPKEKKLDLGKSIVRTVSLSNLFRNLRRKR